MSYVEVMQGLEREVNSGVNADPNTLMRFVNQVIEDLNEIKDAEKGVDVIRKKVIDDLGTIRGWVTELFENPSRKHELMRKITKKFNEERLASHTRDLAQLVHQS